MSIFEDLKASIGFLSKNPEYCDNSAMYMSQYFLQNIKDEINDFQKKIDNNEPLDNETPNNTKKATHDSGFFKKRGPDQTGSLLRMIMEDHSFHTNKR